MEGDQETAAATASRRLRRITKREREALLLVGRCMPYRAVAEKMGITESTLRDKIDVIRRKLELGPGRPKELLIRFVHLNRHEFEEDEERMSGLRVTSRTLGGEKMADVRSPWTPGHCRSAQSSREVAKAYPGSEAQRHWHRMNVTIVVDRIGLSSPPLPRSQRVRAKLRLIAHCLLVFAL